VTPAQSADVGRFTAENANPALAPLVAKLRAWRLAVPVALLLEAHRPLAFFAGQLCHVLAPFLAPWQRDAAVTEVATWLSEDSSAVDRLMLSLEEQDPP
jgi:hypothetical protein